VVDGVVDAVAVEREDDRHEVRASAGVDGRKAHDTTRSRTVGPLPPTSTGGCGHWAGFGHDQMRSNATCSPA
jgi:hypothetical protein